MAKRKRIPSQAQRDKSNIDVAKYLKKQGLISKQAKLHGGRYISRGVLKKVEALRWVQQNNYQAVKTTRKNAQKAREEGLAVFGQRLIVPKDKRSKKRIQQGIITGVRPVPGGSMYMVVLPYTSMLEFLAALQSGELDKFKSPKEAFAFTIYGNQSFKSFRNSQELYEWLMYYQNIVNPFTGLPLEHSDEILENFRLYRLLPSEWRQPSFDAIEAHKRNRRMIISEGAHERYRQRKGRSREDLQAFRLLKERERDAANKKAARAKMTPEQREEYNRKMRERMRKLREERKKGK